MCLYKFNLVKPVIDKKQPFYYSKRDAIVCRFKQRYNYYIETYNTDEKTGDINYYLLLSKYKFNNNCLKINNDNYGRSIIKLHSSFNDYVKNECISRGNIKVEYSYSEDEYDIYIVE